MYSTEAKAQAVAEVALDELWGGRREGLWDIKLEETMNGTWRFWLEDRYGLRIARNTAGWYARFVSKYCGMECTLALATEETINLAVFRCLESTRAALRDAQNQLDGATACFEPEDLSEPYLVPSGSRIGAVELRQRWGCYACGWGLDRANNLLVIDADMRAGRDTVKLVEAEDGEWRCFSSTSDRCEMLARLASREDAEYFCQQMGWPVKGNNNG